MQLPASSGKKCSQCNAPAELDALLCDTCGRVFPMQSASAPMMPPPSVTVARARVSPARQMFAGSVFILAGIGAAFGFHTWYASQDEDRARSTQSKQPPPKTIVAGHALPSTTPNPQFYHAATHHN